MIPRCLRSFCLGRFGLNPQDKSSYVFQQVVISQKDKFQNIYSYIFIFYDKCLFFDYPYINGGGFFHKFSNMFFYNNFVFYFVFIFLLFTIYYILLKNWNNYLLLILLVLLTPQFTNYNKYYDPLIYILFITLFELDMNKHYFKKKYKKVYLYSLSIGYLGIALFKNYLL